MGIFLQEKTSSLLRGQQIVILVNWRLRSLGFQVLQHFVANGQRGRDALDLLQIDLSVALGYKLGCGKFNTLDIDREDADGTSRYRELRQSDTTSLQPYTFLGGEVLQTLIVVDEDKATTVFRANSPAQERIVALLNILLTRETGLHRCQHIAPVLHKQMELAQHVVLWILLPEFIQGRLEVVSLYRQVVVVRGYRTLCLVQIRQSLWVRSTMIHIVAQQVRATAQLHDGHRIGILWIDIRTAMVGSHHTASEFAGEVRILLVAFVQALFLLTQLLCGNGCRRAKGLEVKRLVIIACRLLDAALPEAIGIIAIEGQHLTEGHWRSQLRPSRAGIERQVETNPRGYLLQRHQILAPTPIFVIKLGRHHRTTVFPLESLHLRKDLTIEALHQS